MPGAASVDAYFDGLEGERQSVARALRDLVREVAPSLDEGLKWRQPVFSGRRSVCYIAAEKDHVKLGFFRGASLPDPQGLLEGTGKEMRHIKVRRREGLPRDDVRSLLRSAVDLDRLGQS